MVQERQLHLETNVLKLEDDTNCSLSSIEEDFLTASEHLEEEIEVEDYRSGKTLSVKLVCALRGVTPPYNIISGRVGKSFRPRQFG